ncbi:hypothetical protein FB451DRAFT_1555120 [Mycena latifolia]|nr:hypothetical protein FB451DRAFT_1555120 [Mycena latifolia]
MASDSLASLCFPLPSSSKASSSLFLALLHAPAAGLSLPFSPPCVTRCSELSSAPPSPLVSRPTLSDISNVAASPPPTPFAHERVSSSSRASDPHTSLRRAAAQDRAAFRPHVPADRRVAIAKFSTLRDTCRNTRISRSSGALFVAFTLSGQRPRIPSFGPSMTPRGSTTRLPLTRRSSPFALLGWRHLTKVIFLCASSAVFKSSQLDLVFGRSYRIGGSLELLSAGVAPEVVMKLGGWSSLCFLIYRRRLERILPLAITRARDARIAEFARTHGHPVAIDSLPFE